MYPKVCILLFIVFVFLTCATPQTVLADNLSASDVIAGVNALRAGKGLPPYQMSNWLMGYAQQHSQYQASINTSTHVHSDGTLPWSIGILENVAAGTTGYITVDFIINQIWADAIHMTTMVGFASGFIGVGVASSASTVYITLDVEPGGNPATTAPLGSSGQGANQPTSTPIPIVPLVTATPRADGSVVHVVGYGQSLWSIAIAYGVHIDQIRALNNLPAGSTTIYIGEKLLIRLPDANASVKTSSPTTLTPTGTLTPTLTHLSPTVTASVTLTPFQTVTSSTKALATITQTPVAQSPKGIDRHAIGAALVIVCSVGLLLILVSSVWHRH